MRLFLSLVAVMGLAGCSPSPDPPAAPADTHTKTVQITQAQFGAQWPFSASAGQLTCRDTGEVLFTAQGVTYALNGTARGEHTWTDIEQSRMLAGNFSSTSSPKSLDPIIQRGLGLYGLSR